MAKFVLHKAKDNGAATYRMAGSTIPLTFGHGMFEGAAPAEFEITGVENFHAPWMVDQAAKQAERDAKRAEKLAAKDAAKAEREAKKAAKQAEVAERKAKSAEERAAKKAAADAAKAAAADVPPAPQG